MVVVRHGCGWTLLWLDMDVVDVISLNMHFINLVLLNVFLFDVFLLEVGLIYANLSYLQSCQDIGLQQLA